MTRPSQTTIVMTRDNFWGLIAFLLPGGFSLLNFLDQVRPVLGILGLVVSIAVGITVLILNLKKIREYRRNSHS